MDWLAWTVLISAGVFFLSWLFMAMTMDTAPDWVQVILYIAVLASGVAGMLAMIALVLGTVGVRVTFG